MYNNYMSPCINTCNLPSLQKEKIDKLKGSLEEAMGSHKQTMGDNEKLLTDLQKANETIQVIRGR